MWERVMIIGLISRNKMASSLISQELCRKTLQQLFTYQCTKSFSTQLPLVTQSLLMFGIALTQVHLIWPCWTPWGFCCPISQLWCSYHSFLLSHQVYHSACCHLQTCWQCTQIQSLIRISNNICPLRATTHHLCRYWATDINLLIQPLTRGQ